MTEDKEPKEVKAKPPKLVAVRVVREAGPTALVEWSLKADTCRAYVPKEVIRNLRPDGIGSIEQAELDAGAPYGVAWEQFAPIEPQEVGRQMRRRNIWTMHDLNQRVLEAQAAYLEACGFHIMLHKAQHQEVK